MTLTNRLDGLRSALRAQTRSDMVSDREGRMIVSPRSTEEIATVMRCVNANEVPIEIAGAGTKREWRTPMQAPVVLETVGLSGVREHSWQDLTATVGAGTRWADMQRVLGRHNQQVALDPLWPEAATVGGIVATNDSGALRLKYGSLRDLIIGMTIVLADGTVARSGGKVVKNVAGYDLHKLMIGAFGTLGLVTEVTFRLHPLPAHTCTWGIASSTVESVGELMLRVLDSQLSVQAMQIRASSNGYSLEVGLASVPEVLTLQIEALDSLARSVASFDQPLLRDEDSVFVAREQVFAQKGGVVLKATMLPSSIAKLSANVVSLGGIAVTQANGIMLARFGEDQAAPAVASFRRGIEMEGDGSVTVLRSPEISIPHTTIFPQGKARSMELMREIKRRFDPKQLLNRGNSLGGI